MTPAPSGAFGALEASGLGQAMRQWLWLYPSVEIVHLAGIGDAIGVVVSMCSRSRIRSTPVPTNG